MLDVEKKLGSLPSESTSHLQQAEPKQNYAFLELQRSYSDVEIQRCEAVKERDEWKERCLNDEKVIRQLDQEVAELKVVLANMTEEKDALCQQQFEWESEATQWRASARQFKELCEEKDTAINQHSERVDDLEALLLNTTKERDALSQRQYQLESKAKLCQRTEIKTQRQLKM
eukprot:m.286705 g.286705  ORF g.286705 m.286705 type:complete len:173 (+) comp40696_c1_seq14:183-701(+)